MEEVAACLEKEDKLKVEEIMAEYNKVLVDIKIVAHTGEAAYDNCADKDKVVSIMVANYEAKIKEFQEKNKRNREERDRILSKVEKNSEAIETLR
ncbi:hypothetical protein KI387_028372, partial [Taxus chinensis]